jgi:hypothetical protein
MENTPTYNQISQQREGHDTAAVLFEHSSGKILTGQLMDYMDKDGWQYVSFTDENGVEAYQLMQPEAVSDEVQSELADELVRSSTVRTERDWDRFAPEINTVDRNEGSDEQLAEGLAEVGRRLKADIQEFMTKYDEGESMDRDRVTGLRDFMPQLSNGSMHKNTFCEDAGRLTKDMTNAIEMVGSATEELYNKVGQVAKGLNSLVHGRQAEDINQIREVMRNFEGGLSGLKTVNEAISQDLSLLTWHINNLSSSQNGNEETISQISRLVGQIEQDKVDQGILVRDIKVEMSAIPN